MKAAVEPAYITRDNAHSVEGELVEVYDTVAHTAKFTTRKFVIENGYEYHEEYFESYVPFQLTNHKCDLVDAHEKGSRVHFNLRGTKKSKNVHTGEEMVFTNLDVFRIEKIQDAV